MQHKNTASSLKRIQLWSTFYVHFFYALFTCTIQSNAGRLGEVIKGCRCIKTALTAAFHPFVHFLGCSFFCNVAFYSFKRKTGT